MFNIFGPSREWKYDNLQTPETLEEYQELSITILNHTEQLINSPFDEWTLFKDGNVLVQQKQVPNSSITIVRCTSYITVRENNTLINLAERLYDPTLEQTKELNNNIISYSNIKTITDDCSISKTLITMPNASNREFITLRTIKQTHQDAFLIAIQSINDASHIFSPNTIRGVITSGISLERITRDKIKIITIDHIDPKGWILTRTINQHKETAADWIEKL